MKALFIGLTTVDIQYFVDVFPEANTKVKTSAPSLLVGGPAANAAVACAHLGSTVDFATCIGNNPFSAFIKNDFDCNNVNLIDFQEGEEFSPILASVITSGNGDRNIFTHHPHSFKVSEEKLKGIKIQEYSVVFTDGFYPEMAIPICEQAKLLGIPVVFDGGSWKPHLQQLLPFVDYAICSSNFLPDGCSSEEDVFQFLDRFQINNNAISRGEKSILWKQAGSKGELVIEQQKITDSLGAGDILHGAFSHFYLQDHTFEMALKKASEVASFSCKHKGTRHWMQHFKN